MGTNAFMVQSEPEISGGYADIVLKMSALNPGKYDFLFELKYLKKQDAARLESVIDEGKNQIKKYKYALSEDKNLNPACWLFIFIGNQEFRLTEVK